MQQQVIVNIDETGAQTLAQAIVQGLNGNVDLNLDTEQANSKLGLLAGAAAGTANTLNRAATAFGNIAKNRSGDTGPAMSALGIPGNLQMPFIYGQGAADASGSMTGTGAIFDNLQSIEEYAASLNLSSAELSRLAKSEVESLRASGQLVDEALLDQIKLRRLIEESETFGLDAFRKFGIAANEVVGYTTDLSGLFGPSMNNNLQDFNEAIETQIQRQAMLAQTTGMSVEAQMQATEQLLKTPGALARQMDLITNPKMTQELVNFANSVAAIGASDLAEGFISGVGLPTPGNEIEAALKPMTTALLGQISAATAAGDTSRVRELTAQLQEVYAKESQGVMQQLGRFAPYLGSEFGFLQKDLERQRATMLGIAENPNFVGDQQIVALQNIENLLTRDSDMRSQMADLNTQLAMQSKELMMTFSTALGDGGALQKALEIATKALEASTATTDIVNDLINPTLSDTQTNAAIANIDTAMATINAQEVILESDRELLKKLELLRSELKSMQESGVTSQVAVELANDPEIQEKLTDAEKKILADNTAELGSNTTAVPTDGGQNFAAIMTAQAWKNLTSFFGFKEPTEQKESTVTKEDISNMIDAADRTTDAVNKQAEATKYISEVINMNGAASRIKAEKLDAQRALAAQSGAGI